MTNGTVDARVGSVEDEAFTVKYKDFETGRINVGRAGVVPQ
jgi:hypothetical protein